MILMLTSNVTNHHFINFTLLNDQEGQPFPLYLKAHWKILIVMSLLLIIIQGARLRKVIISYINSPEAGLGPINNLIWVDQIFGILPVFNIAVKIIFILSPIPISELLVPFACTITEFIAAVFIGGSFHWNFSIAVFRVLFVRAQTGLTKTVGIKTMLVGLLVFGSCLIFTFAFLTIAHDRTSSMKKMCFHLSSADLEIMEAYKVFSKLLHNILVAQLCFARECLATF